MNRIHTCLAVALLTSLPTPAADSAQAVFEAIRNNDHARLTAFTEDDLKTRDDHGTTPLMYAAAFGSPDALKFLIDSGASVNAKNDFDATALLWAACDPVRVGLLLEKGASVNVQSKQGRTPLMLAAGCGNPALVATLLSKGASLSSADTQGLTPLHFAASSGDFESLRLLVAKGADVNVLTKNGDSPLMLASAAGSLESVRLLIAKGARVNIARTSYAKVRNGQIALIGLTALMQAAPYGSPALVKELLDAGADPNARDSRDMTPLMFAVASDRQNPEVVQLLLKARAVVDAKSNTGETALDWATKFGNPEVLALLNKAGAPRGTAQPASPHTDLPHPRPAREAIAQAVMLMQRSSAEFFRQSGCVGCHHQPATAVALSAARAAGVKVDETAAKDQANTLRLGWGLSADDMLQGIRRGGGSDRIVTQLLGIWAATGKGDALTDAAIADVAHLQRPNGSWADEHDPRAPLADGAIARAAWAVRALQVFAWPGREAEFQERIALARRFLLASKPLSGDDRAMLVAGLYWAGASEPEVKSAALDLIKHQNADGGWSANDNLPSDAFTTAESLVALKEVLEPTDTTYRNGVAYLLKTQFADGSWYAPSRAVKFQPYFQSGFPFEHDQWISAAATGLAVTALEPAAGLP